jgi:hypothetical protein
MVELSDATVDYCLTMFERSFKYGANSKLDQIVGVVS